MKIKVTIAICAAVMATAAVAAPTASVSRRFPGLDGGWDYATVDPQSNRLFVARSNGVMTLDLATGVVVPQLVPATRTHAAFAIPGTGLGIVTSSGSGGIILFDAATGAIKAELKTGPKPDAAIYDPVSKKVLVMDNADGSITLVDPVAAKIVARIAVGGALEFAALDGHGHVFVNVEDKNELVMVNVAAGRVLRRTALTGCEEPNGLALTRKGILIASCSNGVAKTVDAKSGKLLADIAIGRRPDAVIYDAKRERAYIPTGSDGMLTVIDTSVAPRAIGKIATQQGSRSGAVDLASGLVYVPAAQFVPDNSGKPKPVPGSFQILQIAPR